MNEGAGQLKDPSFLNASKSHAYRRTVAGGSQQNRRVRRCRSRKCQSTPSGFFLEGRLPITHTHPQRARARERERERKRKGEKREMIILAKALPVLYQSHQFLIHAGQVSAMPCEIIVWDNDEPLAGGPPAGGKFCKMRYTSLWLVRRVAFRVWAVGAEIGALPRGAAPVGTWLCRNVSTNSGWAEELRVLGIR